MIYHFHSIVSPSVLAITKTFLIGFVMDSCVVATTIFILMVISGLLYLLLKERIFKFLYHTLNFLAILILFTNTADVFFFNQYGVRLNTFAGEAANDPGKIIATAWQIYPIVKILFCFGIFAFIFIRIHKKLFRSFTRQIVRPDATRGSSFKWGIITTLSFIAVSFLYYGPPMWTLASFSDSSVLNQASLNGVYTYIKAYDQQRIYEDDIPNYDFFYHKIALHNLQETIVKPNDSLCNPLFPTQRKMISTDSFHAKNVVIIIMESFGGKYIGKVNEGKSLPAGRQGFSPNFDRIADSGMLFTHFRANGPRTQNGIFSAVAGYPSILGINLQRRKGATEFQTLGNILLTKGYETKFIHNGHADYDDMDQFMKQGGFQTIFDVNNYTKWRMKNEWGVSDEDLYEKSYDMIWNKSKPVLSVLLTMSNHDPHELPEEFKKLHPEVKTMDRNQATFYYSDVALGNFLDKCAKHPQYKNTLFLIFGDHGEAYDPADNECKIFHVPCLILNSKQGTGITDRVASQCDVPSTVLADLNYTGNYHFIGQDMLGKNFKPYSFMRSYGDYVYMAQDTIMLKYYFETGKSEFFYIDKHLYQRPAYDVNKKIQDQMTAYTKTYLQSISWIYRKGKYRFAN